MTFGRFTIRLVLTPFLACAAIAVQSVQLGGKLSDAAGQPRAGAVVVASPLGAEPELFAISARATSDAQGRFQLELEPGVYTLSTIADASTPTCALSAAIQVAADAKPAECALAPGPADLPFAGTGDRRPGPARDGRAAALPAARGRCPAARRLRRAGQVQDPAAARHVARAGRHERRALRVDRSHRAGGQQARPGRRAQPAGARLPRLHWRP
jgi:hypothetical protein